MLMRDCGIVGSNPTPATILRQGFGWQAGLIGWIVYILESVSCAGKTYVGSAHVAPANMLQRAGAAE